MTAVLLRQTAPAPPAAPIRPAPDRSWVPDVAWPLAGVLGFGLAFAFTYGAFVLTAAGQRVENAIVGDAQSGRLAAPGFSAGTLAGLDVRQWVYAGLLAVIVIAVAGRRPAAGAAAVGLVAVSLAGAQYLKLTGLTRPALDTGGGVAHHNSFPSGHVCVAMAVLLAIAMVLPRRARSWATTAGAVGVGWVAYATVALGWHRPSDAIGGSLLVAGVCCAALVVLAGLRAVAGAAPTGAEPLRGPRRSLAGTVAVPVAVALGGPLLIAGAAFITLPAVPTDAHAAAVLAGLTSFAVALVMGWLTGTAAHR